LAGRIRSPARRPRPAARLAQAGASVYIGKKSDARALRQITGWGESQWKLHKKTRWLELVARAVSVPVAAVLWPPFYNRVEPVWLGLPFFYWYQLLWVILSALITAVIYIATDE